MTKAAAAEAAAKACMAKAPATEGHSPAAAHTAAANTAAACCPAGAETVKARASAATAGKKNLCIIAFSTPSTRLGARGKERCFIWGVRARIGERPRHFVADLGKNEQKTALAMGRRSC
jgi:hypothetical protein